MKRSLACAASIIFATLVHAQEPKGGSSPAPIVFFDIAGPNPASQKSFYEAVFGITTDATGQFQVPAVGATIPGLLRTEASKETMVYFGVADVKATLEKVVANGGKIHTPRYEVKGVVILGILIDPAGNRVGIVEMKDGRAIVP